MTRAFTQKCFPLLTVRSGTLLRMQRQFAALAALALLLGGCASVEKRRDDQLARVARDWCLTIRASQVLPVYPLTEDVQVGDVFLVSTPLEDEVKNLEASGFLPLDNGIARLQPVGWQQFYNGAYGVSDGSVLPRQWQFPAPPPAAPPLTAWSSAPAAAFPSYTFEVKRGAGANLAIPLQSVPVGLSLLQTGNAYGTVNISSASTYGLPITVLSPQIDAWALENQDFLRQYGPRDGKHGKVEQNYVRVVYRVYVAGGVNVSLIDNESGGGSVSAGAGAKPVALFDAGQGGDPAAAAKNYQAVLSSLSQSIAAASPSASISIAAASSRGIALNETFARPLVIGYLAFDRAIDGAGRLGPPVPTHARVTGQPVNSVTATYGTDDNANLLRAWIAANAANRTTLERWLAANAASTSVATFLNGSQYGLLRDKAVQELKVQE